MEMFGRLAADLRFAVRGYRRRAGLTASIVAILAIALFAVTSIYSLLDWVVLRPLPYPDAKNIYSVGAGDRRATLHEFDLLQRSVSEFDRLAVSRWTSATLLFQDEAEPLDGDTVNAAFFAMFGAHVAMGRTFSAEEYTASAAPVTVISYELWQRVFQGDPQIVGKAIVLNSTPYVVAGVLAGDFHDPQEYRRHVAVDLWLPLIRQAGDERARLYNIDGHLARPNSGAGAVRMMELQRSLTGTVQLQLLLLAGAVGLLLLIACANVAGLLLARGASVEGEMAVRLALGATRRRLMQQHLTETVLLSLAAGALGVLMAGWLLGSVGHFIPFDLLRAAEARIDGRVVMFALVAALFTGVACGVWPALRAAGAQLSETLRSAAAGLSADRRWQRMGSAFVILQIGLSFTLVAGATLLARSFWMLENVDAEFTASHVLSLRVRLLRAGYKRPEQRSAFYAEAVRRLSLMPGVTAAALVTALPLGGSALSEAFLVQDHAVASDEQRAQANWNLVSPGYFRVMGIGLVAGRMPNADDLKRSQDFVVINREIAEKYWPHESAVGRRVRFGSVHDGGAWKEVIGVVNDVRHAGLDAQEEAQIYQLYPAMPPPFGYFVVRTNGDPAVLGRDARKLIGLLEKEVPVDRVATMAEVVSGSIAAPRFRAEMLMAFGGFAMMLFALGLYSAIAYSVAGRRREIGMRMALGASPRVIRNSVLAGAGRLLVWGLAAGSVGAVVFLRALRSFVFGVGPMDGWAMAGPVGLLLAVGLGAAMMPAVEAGAMDPVVAIREQ
jgi:putative ABC transport system permease protein